jgi:hypothetical protein
VTATDKASTAALAAQVVDSGVAAAGEGEEGTKPAATIAAPVPHGSLVPLHLNPDPNPTFDVDALPIKDADGNDLFDLDLDALEEKPWRQPGANLADYFNYGMNEATWKNYVRKQREMRKSESVAANPFAVRSSPVLSSSSFAGVQIFHDTDLPPFLFYDFSRTGVCERRQPRTSLGRPLEREQDPPPRDHHGFPTSHDARPGSDAANDAADDGRDGHGCDGSGTGGDEPRYDAADGGGGGGRLGDEPGSDGAADGSAGATTRRRRRSWDDDEAAAGDDDSSAADAAGVWRRCTRTRVRWRAFDADAGDGGDTDAPPCSGGGDNGQWPTKSDDDDDGGKRERSWGAGGRRRRERIQQQRRDQMCVGLAFFLLLFSRGLVVVPKKRLTDPT